MPMPVSPTAKLIHSWPPSMSRLIQEANDLTFKKRAAEHINYALLKITGGDAPSLFTGDAGVSEVDGWYMIAKATELAFEAARAVDEEQYYRKMISWAQRAEKAKKGLSRKGRQGRHTEPVCGRVAPGDRNRATRFSQYRQDGLRGACPVACVVLIPSSVASHERLG